MDLFTLVFCFVCLRVVADADVTRGGAESLVVLRDRGWPPLFCGAALLSERGEIIGYQFQR